MYLGSVHSLEVAVVNGWRAPAVPADPAVADFERHDGTRQRPRCRTNAKAARSIPETIAMVDRHGGSPSARHSRVVSATTNQRKATNPTVKAKDRGPRSAGKRPVPPLWAAPHSPPTQKDRASRCRPRNHHDATARLIGSLLVISMPIGLLHAVGRARISRPYA
jgi:hypothetical protein